MMSVSDPGQASGLCEREREDIAFFVCFLSIFCIAAFMSSAYRGQGRRLHDGAPVAAAPPARLSHALVVFGAVLAVATCPSHDAFEAHLAAAAAHPSGYLGKVFAVAERLSISVTAESSSYLLVRIGRHKGRRFLGIVGTWFSVPRLPSPPSFARLSLPRLGASEWMCSSPGAAGPHEQFALLCCIGFLCLQMAPQLTMRHGYCNLRALRSGRVWTVLTANLVHGNLYHLMHNAINVLHLGPVVSSALGCDHFVSLLLVAMIATSAASVAWNDLVKARPGGGSVGASGVTMALVAANAALYPRVVVRMYGVELTAAQVPLVHILLDAMSASAGGAGRDLDVSAHVGGAVAGWVLGQRWRPWYL